MHKTVNISPQSPWYFQLLHSSGFWNMFSLMTSHSAAKASIFKIFFSSTDKNLTTLSTLKAKSTLKLIAFSVPLQEIGREQLILNNFYMRHWLVHFVVPSIYRNSDNYTNSSEENQHFNRDCDIRLILTLTVFPFF